MRAEYIDASYGFVTAVPQKPASRAEPGVQEPAMEAEPSCSGFACSDWPVTERSSTKPPVTPRLQRLLARIL